MTMTTTATICSEDDDEAHDGGYPISPTTPTTPTPLLGTSLHKDKPPLVHTKSAFRLTSDKKLFRKFSLR